MSRRRKSRTSRLAPAGSPAGASGLKERFTVGDRKPQERRRDHGIISIAMSESPCQEWLINHPDLPAALAEGGVEMDSVRLDYLDEVGHG